MRMGSISVIIAVLVAAPLSACGEPATYRIAAAVLSRRLRGCSPSAGASGPVRRQPAPQVLFAVSRRIRDPGWRRPS